MDPGPEKVHRQHEQRKRKDLEPAAKVGAHRLRFLDSAESAKFAWGQTGIPAMEL
jgi:hypothetical protein